MDQKLTTPEVDGWINRNWNLNRFHHQTSNYPINQRKCTKVAIKHDETTIRLGLAHACGTLSPLDQLVPLLTNRFHDFSIQSMRSRWRMLKGDYSQWALNNKAHDGSMVLVYMLTFGVYWWDPWSTIYSSTMDPMGSGRSSQIMCKSLTPRSPRSRRYFCLGQLGFMET